MKTHHRRSAGSQGFFEVISSAFVGIKKSFSSGKRVEYSPPRVRERANEPSALSRLDRAYRFPDARVVRACLSSAVVSENSSFLPMHSSNVSSAIKRNKSGLEYALALPTFPSTILAVNCELVDMVRTRMKWKMN